MFLIRPPHAASYILSLDIQNFTNHQNVYGTDYDRLKKEVSTNYMVGIFPTLNYRIEF